MGRELCEVSAVRAGLQGEGREGRRPESECIRDLCSRKPEDPGCTCESWPCYLSFAFGEMV